MNLGLLSSHRGSLVQAIVEACQERRLEARPAVVISNNARSGVLQFARDAGLPAHRIGGPSYSDPDRRDAAILETLQSHGVDLVLLLGYMKLLGPRTLGAYEGRILNTHPALLPRHGGQGMYGMRVHEAVIASGDTETGITLHQVDEIYDHGRILAQREVRVEPGDTPETLAERVQSVERPFLVESLQRIVSGELSLAPPAGSE